MPQFTGILRVQGLRANSRMFGRVWIGALALTRLVSAAQVDISGPAGSVAFGTSVTVLSNGDFVVTDPNRQPGIGAVYLYSPSGTLISTLTGSSTYDHVGSGGVVVVGGGNFVVLSPSWNNGVFPAAGAVTWVSGTTGLTGVVSADNSLIGTSASDIVGINGVTVLGNGNYVVASPNWNNTVGAATWGNGSSGVAGPVSATNSLIGVNGGDSAGSAGIFALSNGNYVVASPSWSNVGLPQAGAVTWANGSMGLTGVISADNSLVGTTVSDQVGNYGVTALSNGNYMVASPYWNNGVVGSYLGAATWGNGSSGITGPVSARNSLVGTTTRDYVGSGVIALSNGNYVVASSYWNNGVANSNIGAATWGNGSSGITGPVSTSNSLFGSSTGDQVGFGLTALCNGSYVVASLVLNNQTTGSKNGATTWGNGNSGIKGPASDSNSLIGKAAGEYIGYTKIFALSNGNYVVANDPWNNGVTNRSFGSATWGSGSNGIMGLVSLNNSLVGSTAYDNVGVNGVTALSNGNYVVASPDWNDGLANSSFGAATWGNGSGGITGPVSASNSLIGTTTGDNVGGSVTALRSGNYVVTSPLWNNSEAVSKYGAVTWGNGSRGIAGPVSASNSLIGSSPFDEVGSGGVTAQSDGNYVISSPNWGGNVGAVTLASGGFRLKGTIQSWNSVLGTLAISGPIMTYAYDPSRHTLIVGRPVSSIVSLFTMDQIFAADFEP